MRTDDTVPRDNEVDADLRRAYRQLATETAPPHLDKAILAAAATAQSPAPKGLWRWRRPLAWVTMIGLSFAIVLEFNQTGTDIATNPAESRPETTPAPLRDAAPAAAGDEDATSEAGSRFAPEPVRRDSMDDVAEAARRALENTVATKTEAEKRSRDEELETMSAPAAAELRESAGAELAVAGSAAPLPADAAAASADASDSVPSLRPDADRQADPDFERATADEPACDDSTRADPERWRNCIADLFEAERASDALVEIGLYRRAFPNEPPPAQAK